MSTSDRVLNEAQFIELTTRKGYLSRKVSQLSTTKSEHNFELTRDVRKEK